MSTRKIILCVSLIFILIISIFFWGKIKPITIEKAKENFKFYEKQIKVIAKNRDLKFETTENGFDDYREYLITIYDEEMIRISFHIPKDEMNMNDNFVVEYYKETKEKDFNIELFLEFVNALASKPITETYFIKFLDAPEEKYPARDNIGKSKKHKIFKMDYSKCCYISYSLWKDK